MDKAELEIAAKMLGGRVYEGKLYVQHPPDTDEPGSCTGCAFYVHATAIRPHDLCYEFRRGEAIEKVCGNSKVWKPI